MFGTCQAAPRIIAGMARRAEAPGPFPGRGLGRLGGGGRGEGEKRGRVCGAACALETALWGRLGAAVRRRLPPRPLPLLDVSLLSLPSSLFGGGLVLFLGARFFIADFL